MTSWEQPVVMRTASAKDAPLVMQFLRELAEYEHLSDTVFLTEETLRHWLETEQIGVLFAGCHEETVGFALYYKTYATFRGQRGLYIEDLFVRPEFRRRGIGRMFFRELARLAVDQGYFRMDWMVLNWNKNSIEFYEKLGGCPVCDWTTYRLQGTALLSLAEKSDHSGGQREDAGSR
ncbi:MAG: GNAT family N-acetyltransferase [Planctomycetaceae bacterium]|jgi:GNAT superfamily N-acetyltransferase|nr:GNAT family N-acetyltransferase [Planctomycetaceae bacterium]